MDWTEFDTNWAQRHQTAADSWLRIFFSGAVPEEADAAYCWFWRKSAFSWFQATYCRPKDRIDLLKQAAETGQKAIDVNRFGVEGHFWLGQCLFDLSRAKAPVSWGFGFSKATKSIERAMRIDESYCFAGPVRLWGRVQQTTPLLLGGNLDNAIASYRRALQLAPCNSTNLRFYAEALWADRRPREAREVCEGLLHASEDPNWIEEQRHDKNAIAVLLQEINKSRDS